MKRFIYLLLLLPFGVCAQNMYNIAPLLGEDIAGTARFMAMGGSMGALGGDVSVMGVNPAGTALYRSSDFAFTAGTNFNNTRSRFGAIEVESDFTDLSLKNFGMVWANRLDEPNLTFLNFGINYRRKNHLSNNFDMYGYSDGFSQQYVIEDIYKRDPFDIDKLNYRMYDNFQYSWLALLAAETFGVDEDGNFLAYEDGTLAFPVTDMGYYSEERGGIDVVDINLSANINDVLYIGATIGFHNVDYSRYSYYYEGNAYNKEIYSLVNNYTVQGNGIDFKLGAIVRPFKYSSFRMGFAVHTPTYYYDLMDMTSASILGPDGCVYDTRDYDLFNDDLRVEYKLRTPWRWNASVAYTFANCFALNAEYEYSDYTQTSFPQRSGISKSQTSEIDYNMKAQEIFRFGAEYFYEGISLRAGYNYQTAPFKTSAYKCLDAAGITETSTEYMNKFKKESVTLGGGYRGEVFYFDVAYMLQSQKADFFPYYDVEYENSAAKVKFLNQTISATVGMRF